MDASTHRVVHAEAARDRTVCLPGSKSITHRLAILAALGEVPATVERPLVAEDTELTVAALRTMGADAEMSAERIAVRGSIGKTRGTEIFLGNSGSSARFLLPLAGFLDRPVTFSGIPRLHERPFAELFDALGRLGMSVMARDDRLPATVYPARMIGGGLSFGILPSSQIVSGLMMAATRMRAPLSMRLPERLPSMPYVDLTLALMERLGYRLTRKGRDIDIEPGGPAEPWTMAVEPDLSAASYWVAYALIHGVSVTLPGVTLPALQGDAAIFDIARQAGASVVATEAGLRVSGPMTRGFRVDALGTPDLVPALAVMGMFAPEPVVITGTALLRHKESDRIAAVQENIAALRGRSDYGDGTLTVYPQRTYRGSVLPSFNDHRIAMSFAIAGTRIPGVAIGEPGCVGKSYPGFWDDLD